MIAKLQNKLTSLLYEISDDPCAYAVRLIVLLAVLFGLIFFVGYAHPAEKKKPLPYCEKYQAQFMYGMTGELYLTIDMENVEKLAALIQGLSKGTCRLPPDEDKTPKVKT